MAEKENTVRIFIADDEAKVRFALRVLLAREPGWQIVGEAADAERLPEQIKSTQPELLLMDWLLPGLDQIGSIETLRTTYPGMTVITMSGRPEVGKAALASGEQMLL